jgi:tRNA (Thr-GGU) A37 N-methylase
MILCFIYRLGGKKVGLFSTRTPHRPNSIGLTVVKIDKVHGQVKSYF